MLTKFKSVLFDKAVNSSEEYEKIINNALEEINISANADGKYAVIISIKEHFHYKNNNVASGYSYGKMTNSVSILYRLETPVGDDF